MKTKLLRRLRRKFYIIYIPSTAKYVVYGDYCPLEYYSLRSAQESYRDSLFRFARKHYSNYRKEIRIT